MEITRGILLPVPNITAKESKMDKYAASGDPNVCLTCKKAVCTGARGCYARRKKEIKNGQKP